MSAVATSRPVETWYSIADLMMITKFKRTFLYGEMERGALKSLKVGGSRRVTASSLAEWQAIFDGSGEVD
jgi:hypothetical protein